MIFSMDGERRHIVDAVTLDAVTTDEGVRVRLGSITEEKGGGDAGELSIGEAEREQLRVPPTSSYLAKRSQPEIV